MNLKAESLFSVRDRTVLLTGATGFIGRAFASALLGNGARLVALGRSERVNALVEKWSADFGPRSVRGYRVDMYDIPALEKTLARIARDEPVIDVLVNNAHDLSPATGFNVPSGGLEDATLEHWMRNLTAGIYWAAITTQRIGAGMKARGGGSIVNVSSMYAHVAPNPQLYAGTEAMNPPGYSAAKAGLLALTRYVAAFWGPHGIRANALVPGPFSNTEEPGPNSVPKDDPFLDRLKARTCLGRIGRPEELAGALLFLASDASSYVTGHALVVDGGWTTT